MCSPSSRISFNFPYPFPREFGIQSCQRVLYWGNDPSSVIDLVFTFFSYLIFRLARSTFLLVFLISPAGLKLQEVNSHFVFDLYCPWGLGECLPIMSWPIFKNRVWPLRLHSLPHLRRKCPSSGASACNADQVDFKMLGALERESHSLYHTACGVEGQAVWAVPWGASFTKRFEYSVRSGRAVWEAPSLPGDGDLLE